MGWERAERPGRWIKVTRTFRDGSSQDWWALELDIRPFGPDKPERVVIATTDPATLPDLTTFYLITNLPAPGSSRAQESEFVVANVEEVVRLYGLRMWVEESYKQVKHALGWSEYQVRSDRAIRRHWQLVCCAFSFCWYHQAHLPATVPLEPAQPPSTAKPEQDEALEEHKARKKKENERLERPPVSWPKARRSVRGWLEPWVLLQRFWLAWSLQPPPFPLQQLLEHLWRGSPLYLYATY